MASATTSAVYAAIIGNLAIAIAKFIAAGVTGSSAMLSEGVQPSPAFVRWLRTIRLSKPWSAR